MQLFSRVVCTIFLSLCFFSQAYAVTVPSEEVYFNEVGTRGQHRSLVAACQASMPKSGWYSNPQGGSCTGNWCSCVYEVSINGADPQTVEAQGWATKGQLCPAGMSSSSGNNCAGTPNQEAGGPCPTAGNPIDPLTGNKYQVESDFSAPNGMSVVRYYNSKSKRNLGFGLGWSSNIVGSQLKIGINDILLHTKSGELETFSKDLNGDWLSNTDPRIQLQELPSSYEILRPNSSSEIYDDQGRLQTITYNSGLILSYSFDEDRVVGIANNFGQSLAIHWKDGAYINAIDLPDGSTITYKQTYGKLTHVTYPDNTPTIDTDNTTYEYKYTSNPSLGSVLTSINYGGQKYAEWLYDWKGRANTSRHYADNGEIVEQHTISYTGLDQYQNKVTVTNPLGKQTTYHFQEFQRKRKVTHYEGIASSQCLASAKYTSYNAYGLVNTQTDERGFVTEFVRNARGLVEQKTTGMQWVAGVNSTLTETEESQRVSTTWLPSLPLIASQSFSEKDANGNWVVYKQVNNTWLNNRYIDTVTVSDPRDPLKLRTTSYTYTFHDTEQNIIATISIDGPRTDIADTSVFTYSPQGNLVSVSNALGYTVQYANFTATGSPQTITDINGAVTQLTYGPLGKLLTSTLKHPSGNASLDRITQYDYTYDGQLEQVTSPDGSFIGFEYDAARRLVASVDATGNRMEYGLDVASNVVAETIKNNTGQTTYALTKTYDELSRVRMLVQNYGQETEFNYDVSDNLVATTNPRDYDTDFDLDALARVTKSIDSQNNETATAYNTESLVTQVTDARGLATHYEYDGLNNLLSLQSPDTGTTTYTHDAAGNILSITDNKGVVKTYTYDALNRVTQIDFSTGDTSIVYGYDDTQNGNAGKGKLTSINDESGQIHFVYDYDGSLTAKNYVIGVQNYSLLYASDNYGRLASTTYPSGHIISYQYSAVGQLAAVFYQSNAGSTAQVLVDGFSYLPFGAANDYDYGNSVAFEATYNLDYALTNMSVNGTSVLMDRSYQYDDNGNIEQIVDNTATVSQLFTYDFLDRLDTADGHYGDINFDYDAVGNRTLKALIDGTDTTNETYILSPTSNQLNSIDINENGQASSRAFTYDNNGSLTLDVKGGASTVTVYDGMGRPDSWTVNGQTVMQAVHNSLGQRTVKSSASSTEHFHYDEAGRLIAVSLADGTVIQEYVYLGYQAIAMIDSGQVYYIHNDHLATPQLITNANQAVVWQVDEQTPFGEVVVNNDVDADGNSLEFNLRFPGQYFDEETGLSYNYFRTYDASLGRYVQSDPIGLNGGINTYGYVLGNPLRFFDPLGLEVYCYWSTNMGNTVRVCENRPDDYDPRSGSGIPQSDNEGRPYSPTGDAAAFSPYSNNENFNQCMSKCYQPLKSSKLCKASVIGNKGLGKTLCHLGMEVSKALSCSNDCMKELEEDCDQ